MGRIIITGDTHQSIDRFYSGIYSSLTKEDVVIIAGDAGFYWNEHNKREKLIRKALSELPFTLCFVDGNHENFNMLEKLPQKQMFGNTVGCDENNIIHLKRGNIYEINNKKFWVFGGAESVDKQHRSLNLSYWRQELPSHKEYENGLSQLEEAGNSVDYIVTHTCPSSIFHKIHPSSSFSSDLEKYLETVRQNTKFNKWFFGHHHIQNTFDDIIALYEDCYEIET